MIRCCPRALVVVAAALGSALPARAQSAAPTTNAPSAAPPPSAPSAVSPPWWLRTLPTPSSRYRPGSQRHAAPLARDAAPAGSAEPTPVEAMRKARSFFEYGDYASASKLLDNHLIDTVRFESGELRGELPAARPLRFLRQGKKGEAYRASPPRCST